jgi:YidC/Oxa1 family membrane protein insertase
MNRNTIIGFVLIALILVIFSWYNAKESEKQALYKKQQDSLYAVQHPKPAADSLVKNDSSIATLSADTATTLSAPLYKDSMLNNAAKEEESFTTLENDKIKIDFTNIGAQIKSVQIKNFTTFDSLPLILVREGKSNFDLRIYAGQELSTASFAFKKYASDDTSVTYRLYADSSAFIQYTYRLKPGSYMMALDIRMSGMENRIQKNATSAELNWKLDLPSLEKGFDNEKNYSTVVYKFPNSNSVERLGFRKESASKENGTKISWFAFQQQFFSAILVSKDNFNSGTMSYHLFKAGDPDRNLMTCEASMSVPITPGNDINVPFEFYFGPNHFKTLKSYDRGFEQIVPLGGWLIGWINRYVIILVFDILSRFISNYGIIILILTLLLKIVLWPLTHKSYMSSAKMRVLKPEVDKINAKYPKSEDAMKKQQEVMALYNKTGVSMFGGCLPTLLQFPILFAMFKFFPASFELRQQGFLWANDLSSYDSILKLPFNIPLYGDHVSLFALLMGVSMFLYSRMNIDQMNTGGPQMAGMKFMSLWFMPVFFLFLGNNFSSGLTYYYLLSNVITMLQTWIIRKYFIDESKLYAKLKEKAAGPAKKSKFQQRLEDAYKVQQQQKRK